MRISDWSSDVCSSDLHLSVRSLQRRLAEEATGFDALLNETRHELEESYLRNPRYSIGEITFLLGFYDASAFATAFKRWRGKTTTQLRTAASTTGRSPGERKGVVAGTGGATEVGVGR